MGKMVLHDNVEELVVFKSFKDFDDVGVVQQNQYLHLVFEGLPAQHRLLFNRLYCSPDLWVAPHGCLIYGPVAAAPQLLTNTMQTFTKS